jgi:hypothetical protein
MVKLTKEGPGIYRAEDKSGLVFFVCAAIYGGARYTKRVGYRVTRLSQRGWETSYVPTLAAFRRLVEQEDK